MSKKILTIILILAIAVISFMTVNFLSISERIGHTAQLISARQSIDTYSCIKGFTQRTDLVFDQQYINLNTDSKLDLVLIHKDGYGCGTAGCIAELCLQEQNGTYRHIPFGYVVDNLKTKPNVINGMHDIQNLKTIFTWNGERYVPEQ
jgi:hypothetical protein